MAYLNGIYYSRKKLREIYDNSEIKTENLIFNTFYQRVHELNWSIEKSLTYIVKRINKRREINDSK